MRPTATVEGQVTVPKAVRDKLRLKHGDRAALLLDASGELRTVPVTASVKQLKGMVPRPKKPVTLVRMDAITKTYALEPWSDSTPTS